MFGGKASWKIKMEMRENITVNMKEINFGNMDWTKVVSILDKQIGFSVSGLKLYSTIS
jgi:hypothetical protein